MASSFSVQLIRKIRMRDVAVVNWSTRMSEPRVTSVELAWQVLEMIRRGMFGRNFRLNMNLFTVALHLIHLIIVVKDLEVRSIFLDDARCLGKRRFRNR